MKFFYDLHIHSDLSPCGNSDMTPNNIMNMSCIKGLNIISVTDHNTAGNLSALMKVSEKTEIKLIPGIEVTTREEVHVLCYFKKLEDAVNFGNIIYDSLPDIKNNPAIFGEQNIYNCNDEIIGTLEKLLLNATKYTIDEVCSLAKDYHGIMVPAHINKKTNSLLGVLGFIPKNLKIDFVEVYSKTDIDKNSIKNFKIFRNSDAHQLTDISEAENLIELDNIDNIYYYMKMI